MRTKFATNQRDEATETRRAAVVAVVALAAASMLLSRSAGATGHELPGDPAPALELGTKELLVPSADRSMLFLPGANGHGDRLRRIELERGKSAVLKTGFPLKRVSVGDPKIADVVVLGTREMHLVAKSIGDTNLVVWNSDGKLEAAIDLHVGASHSQIEIELQRALGNDTIRVTGAGESVLLKGTVSSPAEMERAVQVARAYFPDKEQQSGSDKDTADSKSKEKKSDRVINMLEIGGNQQVMIEVVLAEMDRTFRRNLGTNFAGVTSVGGTDVTFFSFLQNMTRLSTESGSDVLRLASSVNMFASIANGSDQLDIFIEAIQEEGLAKILAEPNLVARSGEEARFLVGGEVPIPVPQSGAIGVITIEYKEFGVGVTFTPTVLGPNRIHMNVSTEVSEPDITLGTQLQGFVVPAFNTRRASTGVELGDGQTFAIAGLLREDVRELAHQFPLLGDIPILGALFRSTRFEKKETELVMMVTPRLVKPLPVDGPRPLPTDHFIEPNAFEFFLMGELEGGVMSREYDRSADAVAAMFGDQEAVESELAEERRRPKGLDEIFAEPTRASEPNPSLADWTPDQELVPVADADPWAGDGLAGDAGHRVGLTDSEGGL